MAQGAPRRTDDSDASDCTFDAFRLQREQAADSVMQPPSPVPRRLGNRPSMRRSLLHRRSRYRRLRREVRWNTWQAVRQPAGFVYHCSDRLVSYGHLRGSGTRRAFGFSQLLSAHADLRPGPRLTRDPNRFRYRCHYLWKWHRAWDEIAQNAISDESLSGTSATS